MKTQLQKDSTDARRAEAQEVINILNRWDARMKGHQTQKRAHERLPYTVRLGLYSRERTATDQTKSGIIVWSRNVCPKGIGFVYKGRIDWKRVLLCLDLDAGGVTWMDAEIVRCRSVHNEFWDYGARFIRRVTRDESLPPEQDVAD